MSGSRANDIRVLDMFFAANAHRSVLIAQSFLSLMRISSQWLRDYVAVPDNDDLAHLFEMAGLGVESRDNDVFSLEVTSNRGDCLSAVGIAREIAAMTGKTSRVPNPKIEDENGAPTATIEIENAQDCPRYACRIIENVTLGASPDWMQTRLIECGMRPLNVVVDITNYVMLELGQPLHAFDADRVLDNHIVVRRARVGEKLTTLDDIERELNPEVLLIADREKAIGIAGIMGGRDSEITENTRRILLESAHFAPSRVRRGARSLSLATEASRRFERSVDPNGAVRALNRATELLLQHANGQLSGALVDSYPQPVVARQIALRVARCNAILGLKLSSEIVVQALEKLTFKVELQSEGVLQVTIPSFRADITREIDLVEEVARIYGYDKIPTSLPRSINPMAGRSLSQRLEERAKSALLRCGLNEIVTLSMTNRAAGERAGLPIENAVELRNPLSEDFTQLRTSLVPSLLDVLSKNIRGGARVFELGRVYLPQENQAQPNECRRLGMAMMDGAASSGKPSTGIDFFALKAVVETALSELGAPRVHFSKTTRAPFHPGRCAVLSIDSQDIGVMGEVHPEVRARYDLNQRAYIAILDFDILARHVNLLRPHSPVSRFPMVERDLALVLNDDVAAMRVENVLRSAGGELLREARVFDVYKGAPIPEGQKSVAIALRFQSNERTLKDEETEDLMTRLRQAAQSELGATLR